MAGPQRRPLTLEPREVAEADEECRGWLNGTRGVWSDPEMPANRHSQPGGFTSGGKQDRQLFETIFQGLGRPGVYADVAANHYKRISNTYFFDRCLGWRGLCVEANELYWPGLERNRSCELIKGCVSNSTAEVQMLLPKSQWLGGLGGINNGTIAKLLLKPNGDMRRHVGYNWYEPAKWEQVRMRCVLLGDEFTARDIRHIDLMSMDLEGHEEAALRSIDWGRVTIDHILCEANCDTVLRPLGYQPLSLNRNMSRRRPPRRDEELVWSRRHAGG